MGRKIPEERQAAYYIGGCLTAVGVLLFFGGVASGMMSAQNARPFEGHEPPSPAIFIVGMALAAVGAIIASIASKGLAGSGVILDPEKAREDLEPYSRMAGGMVKDALDEAGIKGGTQPEVVVKIRCQTCGKLNEEDSKFCQECGTAMIPAHTAQNDSSE